MGLHEEPHDLLVRHKLAQGFAQDVVFIAKMGICAAKMLVLFCQTFDRVLGSRSDGPLGLAVIGTFPRELLRAQSVDRSVAFSLHYPTINCTIRISIPISIPSRRRGTGGIGDERHCCLCRTGDSGREYWLVGRGRRGWELGCLLEEDVRRLGKNAG